jgi:mono/diheme cytochrome c family protein
MATSPRKGADQGAGEEHGGAGGRGRRDRARLAAWLASGVLVLVAALALVRLGEWGGGADPRDPRQLALGARVYAEHCASCHGADLEGQPDWRQRRPDGRLPAPPHDETGHTWHHPDRHLFEVTKHGTGAIAPPGYRTNMIGFGDRLSDTEIWAALAFIKSAWPPEIRRRQEALNRTTR